MIVEKFGKVLPATLSESAWQVVHRTRTYHRGQIATRIREIGGEPPLVDFLYWVWGGKPAPNGTHDMQRCTAPGKMKQLQKQIEAMHPAGARIDVRRIFGRRIGASFSRA